MNISTGAKTGRASPSCFKYSCCTYNLNLDYKSIEIPKIEINNIPKEVSDVRFVSNLINSNNIILNIDELIQPFTKDNKYSHYERK
jgi:hypothetical protein